MNGYAQITVMLQNTSRVSVRDSKHPSINCRVVTIAFDALTIHIEGNTDAEIAANAAKLIVAARQVRDNAEDRMAREESLAAAEEPVA